MNLKKISPGRLKLPIFCILIIIPILIIGMFFLKTKGVMDTSFKNIEIDSSADIIINNFIQTSKTNGIKKWSLKATSAKIVNAGNLALLDDILVKVFTKDNTQIEISAQNGKLNTKNHDIELADNVIVNYEGFVLKTDKLHYEKNSHIIYSAGKVEIGKGDSAIQADKLYADLNNSTFKLEGNVKGKFIETINFL